MSDTISVSELLKIIDEEIERHRCPRQLENLALIEVLEKIQVRLITDSLKRTYDEAVDDVSQQSPMHAEDFRIPIIDSCSRCAFFQSPWPVIKPFDRHTLIGLSTDHIREEEHLSDIRKKKYHSCMRDDTLEFDYDHMGIHGKCPLPSFRDLKTIIE